MPVDGFGRHTSCLPLLFLRNDIILWGLIVGLAQEQEDVFLWELASPWQLTPVHAGAQLIEEGWVGDVTRNQCVTRIAGRLRDLPAWLGVQECSTRRERRWRTRWRPRRNRGDRWR